MPLPTNPFQTAPPLAKEPNGPKPRKNMTTSSFASPNQPRTPSRFVSAFETPKRKRDQTSEMRRLPSPAGFTITTPVKNEMKMGPPDSMARATTPLRRVTALSFGSVDSQAGTSKRQRPLVIPDIKAEIKQDESRDERALSAVTSLPAPIVRDPIEDATGAATGEEDFWVTPSKKAIAGRRTGKPPLSYLLARALTPYNASLNLFYQSLSGILRNTLPISHIRAATLHLRLKPCPPGSILLQATSLDGSLDYELLLQPLPRGCPLSGVDPAIVKARGTDGYEIGVWASWGQVGGVLVCSRYLIAAAQG